MGPSFLPISFRFNRSPADRASRAEETGGGRSERSECLGMEQTPMTCCTQQCGSDPPGSRNPMGPHPCPMPSLWPCLSRLLPLWNHQPPPALHAPAPVPTRHGDPALAAFEQGDWLALRNPSSAEQSTSGELMERGVLLAVMPRT